MIFGVVLFDLELEPPVVFRFLASHVVFGLVLGVVTGLWIPVLQPAL